MHKDRSRKRYTFTFSPDTFSAFQLACGMVPVSRQLEELMRIWLRVKAAEHSPGLQMAPSTKYEKAIASKRPVRV